MLLSALGAVVVGFGFLVVALVTRDAAWAWGCLAACGVGGGLIVVDVLRHRRAAASAREPSASAVDESPTRATEQHVELVSTEGPVAGAQPCDTQQHRDTQQPGDTQQHRDTVESGSASEVAAGPFVPLSVAVEDPTTFDSTATQVQVDETEMGSAGPSAVEPPAVTPAVQLEQPEPAAVAPEPALSTEPPAGPVLVAPPEVEPGEEDVDGADALVVAGLEQVVVVVDEQPRFHLAGCTWVATRTTLSLPAREAVELGFGPCAWCTPSRTLAAAAR